MIKLKRVLVQTLLCCSMLFILPAAFAQNTGKTITGIVTDVEENPLIGVNVFVENTSIGTVTDVNGEFTIDILPDKEITLTFSYLGYLTQKVIPGNKKMEVVLIEDIQSLKEIVVIGYGSQTKKEVTGAVAGVNSEDFNKGNIVNPAQLLQGKVAGLNIVSPQGNPNGDYIIRLRGLSTLGANTQPLIVIDGVVGVDLNSVEPNDIASMDILKDGAAASIYGTRGSSGVILITTKSGKRGKASMEYNTYLSAESKDRTMPVMTKDEYLKYGGTDLGGNTNWMDEITRTAFSHVHNLSVSGGTPQTTYRASFNYRDAQGILLNTGFKQLNGRFNIIQRMFNNRLTVNLSLAATSKDAKLGFDDAFRGAIIMPPSAPIMTDEPYYKRYGGYYQSEVLELYNPVAIVKQNINDQKVKRLSYNILADYNITDNLIASIRYAQNNDNWINGQYISKYSRFGDGVNRNGLATRSTLDHKNNLLEMTGRYSRTFDKLNLSALAGYSFQDFTTERFQMQGGNFLTDAFTYNNFAAARDFTDGKGSVSSFKEKNKLISFFGRLNLNYDNTYFISASLRREGSTRFGSGNKWGNFPGLSAGVDLKHLFEIPFIDQLKIRGSYGITGALPDQSYLSQQLYGPGDSPTYFLNNGVFTPVYYPLSNPNPDLKWETKKETNIGVDFKMINSRLSGTLDYYVRKTTGALITLNVPVPPNLYKTTLLNAGELFNRGLELSLGYLVVQNNKFSWNALATFATYNSEVGSLSIGDIKYGVREVGGLPAPLTGNVIRVEENKPIGQMIGWIYEGVDKNGQYILKNLDNDPAVNDKDVAIIGRGLPKWEFGLTNTFTYRNFDLNFSLRGVYGHNLVNLSRTMFEQLDRIGGWNLVKTKYFNPDYKGKAAFNSYYVEDASFLKLDNLTLGYNIKMLPKKYISSARVYVSGQNLFYITDYSGVDPEVRYIYDNNVLAPGIEPLNSWVTTRTFTIGINLTF